MLPFNPFLRAFFRSNLPSQCTPVHHHILLVPTTDVLLNSRDGDTNALYADLAGSDEFLASHVLRVLGGTSNLVLSSKPDREFRTRTRQYTTLNGRVVMIKDSTVYGSKGFKHPVQTQLLSDTLYHPDVLDAPGWLVYYISRPLTGMLVPIPPFSNPEIDTSKYLSHKERSSLDGRESKKSPNEKDIKSFGGLLYQFPPIAKQMQPALDRVLTELNMALEWRPPMPKDTSSSRSIRSHRRNSSVSSRSGSVHTSFMGQPVDFIALHEEEEALRESVETAVNAAIDVFQSVDRQKLSALSGATNLTGIVVERFIERYVVEHIDTVLFPRISSYWKSSDIDLDRRIRQTRDVDTAQLGIPIANGRRGKRELSARLERGVDAFRKITLATSPQEMLEALLQTLMVVTSTTAPAPVDPFGIPLSEKGEVPEFEKLNGTLMTMSADVLVSLLLVVVIRSNVRQLQARFIYMRYFIFIDDVERGETGYALSTFEAVLSYLKLDSNRLVRSSRRNRRLWQAVKKSDLCTVQAILRSLPPDEDLTTDSESGDVPLEVQSIPPRGYLSEITQQPFRHQQSSTAPTELMNGTAMAPSLVSDENQGRAVPALTESLSDQSSVSPPASSLMNGHALKATKKRVTMQARTLSTSSLHSQGSRSNGAAPSDDEAVNDNDCKDDDDDQSIATLAQTENSLGESLLMMAVESRRLETLRYLLSLAQYFSPEFVLNDFTNMSTTLLSAAIQTGRADLTDVLVDYLLENVPDEGQLRRYLSIADAKGRSAGHYLFHQPRLIQRLGHLIPWTQKDHLGQTPLLALCRSYDHAEYRKMMDEAIQAATASQGDDLPLHLDHHVDNKGNTLLHVVNDSLLALKLLRQCDVDVNSPNEKQFTPLMMVSKYGRSDLVRTLFRDPRVDVFAKDNRGFTAIDLAKDDDVRNRIDDLVLLSSPPGEQGRTTAVVRSFLAEDGSVRLVLKSAMPIGNSSWTVATAPRSLSDFENLTKWLMNEHPASWMPEIGSFISPSLIQTKPSRAVLRDIQIRLDRFLRSLLTHPTFATHEMVWEFFLVPEMSRVQFEERSLRKAEARAEMVRDQFVPMEQTSSVELFVNHAQETVKSLHLPSRHVLQKVNAVRSLHVDIHEAMSEISPLLAGLGFVPRGHVGAWEKAVAAINPGDWSPLTSLYYNLDATVRNMSGILTSLKRPGQLISGIGSAKRAEERHLAAARRSERWPTLGILDGTRIQREAMEKARTARTEQDNLGRELSYTQQVIAGDLAGWQDQRLKLIRRGLKDLVSRTLSVEKARLENLVRAARHAGMKVDDCLPSETGASSSSSASASSSLRPVRPYRQRRPGDPV